MIIEKIKVGNVLAKITRKKKIPKEDYLLDGEIPVIDQSTEYIAGYTNDLEAKHEFPLPITVFGDHTRIIKFVNFPFASGADGTQLLFPDTSKVDPTYFYYALKSVNLSNYFYARHFKFLKEKEIPIFSIQLQRRIAEILSAYDDLIENNLKRIRLLEESARLLYREWFVRLKFPNHEHTPLIDGLPEGWERLAVPEFIEVNPRTPIDKDKENCFIEMANLSNDSMLVSSLQRKKGNSGSKFQKGDTLFARITPCLENGKTGFVNFLEEGEVGFGSTEFIVLRAKSVPPEFVYCLSRTYHFRENAIKNMVGSSGRQRVKTSCFDEFFVGVPPKKILDEFESITRPCFRQIRNLQLQNQKLKQARDLLLPSLMSGEIAV